MINLSSTITQKLLSYFFLQPSSELYLNELTRILEVDRGNLVRKLKELTDKIGILKSEFKGNQHYYSLNHNYFLIEEYKNIVLKTFGLEHDLKKLFKSLKGINRVIIFGSYASNKMEAESDIDLLVVGNCPHLSIVKLIDKIQSKIGREINVIDFDEKEYQDRIKRKDPFIMDILANKMIKVI